MNKFNLPNLGYGLGLRAKHYDHIITTRPKVDWFEIISENFMDSKGRPRERLDAVRAHYPIVMHGVSLSIGSTDPLNMEYLKRLKALAEDIKPAWISDHLCWTGINKKNNHDLLPVPLTTEALDHIVPRIKQVQDFLGRPILLENPSSYLTFRADHIPEYEFMAELAERADCALLLDVNNIYVASFNQRLDPKKYIDAIPADRVVQMHLAGHLHKGNYIVDTHDNFVTDAVWDLYSYAIGKVGKVATMVEWDSDIPEFEVLEAELDKARKAPVVSSQYSENKPTQLAQATNHDVRGLQTSMQNAIHAGSLEGAETWIAPKENFAPSEQLSVYVKGYRLRILDILADDYEVTREFLGKEKFHALSADFIESTKSEFYNMSAYSAKFVEWLEKQDVPLFSKEAASLECAVADCFNHPESEALIGVALMNFTPMELMEQKIVTHESAILRSYKNNVQDYYSDFYQKKKPKTQAEEIYLMIHRREEKVYREELEKPEYLMLKAMQEGKTVGEAIEESGLTEAELVGKVQTYFSKWITYKMLAPLSGSLQQA